MRFHVAIASLACALVISGCRRDTDEVKPLVLILSPAHGAHLRPEQLASFGAFLGSRSGRAVKVQVATSPDKAVEAFAKRDADMGLVGVFDYLFAHREFGAQAVLQVLRGEGRSEYAADLVVRTDGNIHAVADLSGRKVAFVDRYSTSGFVLPVKLLADAGVKPIIEFAGSHEAALGRLRAGAVDAAATFHGAVAQDTGLRVLATSTPIPNEPVVVRRYLDDTMRDRLVAALCDYAATADGRLVLGQAAGITGFRPTSDERYRLVEGLVRDAGKSIEALVPGGYRLWSRYRIVESP